MAQYFTDYSGTTVGQQPADTTLKRNAVSGNYTRQDDGGAAVLRFLHTGTVNAKGLDYNPIDSSGVTEVFAVLRDADSSNPTSARLVTFASDGPDNEYGCWASPNTSFDSVIYKRVNGSFTSLGSADFAFATTEYVNVRFRVTPGSPNRLQLRVWKELDPEPGTWLLDVTDSAFSLTTGWVGHVGFDDNVSIFFKKIGIGTDGDAAPTEALSTGTTIDVTAQAQSATSVITLSVSLKGIRITLVDPSGNPAANLTALKYALFDAATPDLINAVPIATGANGTTNASGDFEISIDSISPGLGSIGSILITDSDGNPLTASSSYAHPAEVIAL